MTTADLEGDELYEHVVARLRDAEPNISAAVHAMFDEPIGAKPTKPLEEAFDEIEARAEFIAGIEDALISDVVRLQLECDSETVMEAIEEAGAQWLYERIFTYAAAWAEDKQAGELGEGRS